MMDASVAALADLVGGRLVGDGQRVIVGLGDLRTAGPDRIGFVRGSAYHAAAASTRAGAVIVTTELRTNASQIVVADADVAYAKIALLFHPLPRAMQHSLHPTAVVDAAAEIESPVRIDANAVVGRCRIGRGTVLMAGVSVGDGCVIGSDCVVYPNVVLYPGTKLGNRVYVHSGAVIGSDGFGYARDGATWIKVPQLGSAVLEDDVEIGAGTTIDRGTLGVTQIGARTKIDNLCHIGHNCAIGADVVMAGGVMIAGSTSIGDRCTLAGSAKVNGHTKVVADVRIGGGSQVFKDITEPGDYMGVPLLEKRQYLRLLRKLANLAEAPTTRTSADEDADS